MVFDEVGIGEDDITLLVVGSTVTVADDLLMIGER